MQRTLVHNGQGFLLPTNPLKGLTIIKYDILSSGSKGNCVIINGSVMVDAGIAFKHMKDKLYDVRTLLMTHIHSDHIKPSTLKQIVMMFPRIKMFGNYEVCQTFSEFPITCINEDVPFEHDGKTFLPFRCLHDVLTYGYVWSDIDEEGNEKDIIYATDTSDLRHAPDEKFDYLFIESNHDETKIKQLIQRTLSGHVQQGYDVVAGAKRHMSTQVAKTFYYMHRKSPDSKFIELHKSSRFY